MFKKDEIVAIGIITLIIAFSINLMESASSFLFTLGAVFLVLIINIIAKKISSYYLESEVEIKIWEMKRYGYRAHSYLKKAFPMGAFLPLISKVFLFPLNSFVWMGSLVFDVKAKIYRSARKHGLYKFSTMTEYHIGLIAASGIFANMLFAFLGYLINFPEFARLNLYYAFFNLIPFSDLDGNKIFFGSQILWTFLATIVLIGMFFLILTI